jgi:hypothetical protein
MTKELEHLKSGKLIRTPSFYVGYCTNLKMFFKNYPTIPSFMLLTQAQVECIIVSYAITMQETTFQSLLESYL